jgi:hypothetical protein
MNNQLVLLDDDEDRPEHWGLDEHTREVGRRGLALAREALRQANRRAA